MKSNLFLTALAIAFLIISCGEQKEKTVTEPEGKAVILNYKFKKGQVFYVTLNWYETVQSKDTAGRGNIDTIDMVSTFKYTVNNVTDDGSAELTINYDHMKMAGFDSDDSTTFNTQQGMMFSVMAKYVMQAKMDKTGFIYELTGADEFYTMGEPDTLVKDNEVMMADLNQFFHVVPSNAVKKGDTWNMTSKIDFGYSANFNSNYVVKSITGNIATIEVTSEITENPDGTTVFPGGFVLKQKFKGKHNSTIQFDIEKGMPVHVNANYFYEGQARGTMKGQQLYMNMTINLKKDISITE